MNKVKFDLFDEIQETGNKVSALVEMIADVDDFAVEIDSVKFTARIINDFMAIIADDVQKLFDMERVKDAAEKVEVEIHEE